MSNEREYPGFPSSAPLHWLGGGALLSALGGGIAAGDQSQALGVVLAAIGGTILLIGAVAKGVEVGIRNARD